MKRQIIYIFTFPLIALFLIYFAVSAFYVKENSTAVIDWFNNEIVVTNDDYKDLVIETNVTIGQLNERITTLEDENFTLIRDKDFLTQQVEILQDEATSNEALIQTYLAEIESLNAQLAENNALIEELRSLINEMSSGIIEDILELPEDLKDKTLSFYWVGNNFFVVSSGSLTLYYFDYEKGVLTFIANDTSIRNYHVINDICLMSISRSNSYYLYSYNMLTGEYKSVVSYVDSPVYLDYNNGCYVFNGGLCYYYDCETEECTKVYYSSSTSSISYNYYTFSDKLFVVTAGSTSTQKQLIYFDLELKTYSVISSNVAKALTNVKVFEFKNNYYVLTSTNKTPGLYKINFETLTLDLVSEIPYDNTSYLYITNIMVLEDVVVFNDYTTAYSFDGVNVSEITTSAGVYSKNEGETLVLYEDDTQLYFTNTAITMLYKLDKITNIVTGIYDSLLTIQTFTLANSNTLLFTAENLCSLDLTSGVVVELAADSYTYGATKYFETDEFIFIGSSNKNLVMMYVVKRGSLELTKVSINSLSTMTDCYFGEGKILLYGADKYCIYDYVAMESSASSITYDSALSNMRERIIFENISTLEDGVLCYKYVYTEDLSDYTKTLVVVK